MSKGKRPKLALVSEEMRRTFALLAEEAGGWPGVRMKPMFGLRALYREGVVFAMLPDKRSLEVVDAVAYKVGGVWKTLAVKEVGGALAVLQRAYERAE